MWDTLCSMFDNQTILIQADIYGQMSNLRCPEGGNVIQTLDKMNQLANEYASTRGVLEDHHHIALIIRAIPNKYCQLVQTMMTVAAENGTQLSPTRIINHIVENAKIDQAQERQDRDEQTAMAARFRDWKKKKHSNN